MSPRQARTTAPTWRAPTCVPGQAAGDQRSPGECGSTWARRPCNTGEGRRPEVEARAAAKGKQWALAAAEPQHRCRPLAAPDRTSVFHLGPAANPLLGVTPVGIVAGVIRAPYREPLPERKRDRRWASEVHPEDPFGDGGAALAVLDQGWLPWLSLHGWPWLARLSAGIIHLDLLATGLPCRAVEVSDHASFARALAFWWCLRCAGDGADRCCWFYEGGFSEKVDNAAGRGAGCAADPSRNLRLTCAGADAFTEAEFFALAWRTGCACCSTSTTWRSMRSTPAAGAQRGGVRRQGRVMSARSTWPVSRQAGPGGRPLARMPVAGPPPLPSSVSPVPTLIEDNDTPRLDVPLGEARMRAAASRPRWLQSRASGAGWCSGTAAPVCCCRPRGSADLMPTWPGWKMARPGRARRLSHQNARRPPRHLAAAYPAGRTGGGHGFDSLPRPAGWRIRSAAISAMARPDRPGAGLDRRSASAC